MIAEFVYYMLFAGITEFLSKPRVTNQTEQVIRKTFSNNMLQLVNDPGLRQKFSNAGKDHVVNKFSYHRLVNDMSGLYHDLLDKKNYRKK